MRKPVCIGLLTVVLVGCTAPASSPQPSTSPPTSTGQAVHDAPKQVPPWEPSGFRLEGKQLPRDFQGTDGKAFGELFKKVSDNAAKGPYETTAQHRARIRDLKAALSPIDPGQDYAFVIPDVLFSYDADRGAYVPITGFCGYADTWAKTDHPDPACVIATSITEGDAYGGATASGGAAQGGRTIGDYYALVIPLHTARRFLKDGQWTSKCPTPIEHARTLAGLTIEYALVGRVSSAAAVPVPDNTQKPGTFLWGHGIPFAPSQLICFVRETGEVLSETASQR